MKRLVFVDDTPIILKTIKLFLKELIDSGEVHFESYTKPVEFYEKAKAGEIEFDILFVDINMPKMDGYQLAKGIKDEDHLKEIPIIAITTEMSNDSKRKAKSVGIEGWITKISSPEIMKTSIKNILRRYK
jgi:CheY-like chemotaxis protein